MAVLRGYDMANLSFVLTTCTDPAPIFNCGIPSTCQLTHMSYVQVDSICDSHAFMNVTFLSRKSKSGWRRESH